MTDGIVLASVAATAAVAALLAAVFAVRARSLGWSLAEARVELQAERAAALANLERLAAAQAERTEARTRLEETERALGALKEERNAATIGLEVMRKSWTDAERSAALDRQAREAVEKRLADWETAKAENLNHAKAAVLETAAAVSNKLIDDHKRETDAARQEREERLKALADQFEAVTRSVAALADQTSQTRSSVDVVWRALSSPGGAGYFAEIGLENTLKSFGLERDRDFVMQATIDDEADGRRLRPDAIIFLPNDSLLVIDSKASKYLLELAAAEGGEGEAEAYGNLARTMHQHLRTLAGKDYRSAVVNAYRQAGRSGEVAHVVNVMYLPNEGALDKVRKADPAIEQLAHREQIVFAGPTGLAGMISFASSAIGLGRQAQNQERIIEAAESLLDSVAVALGHVDGVGKGLKAAAAAFERFALSVNKRLLPRAKHLVHLGVSPTKSRGLPSHLPAIHIVDIGAQGFIEGEAQEVGGPSLVEGPPAGNA
jgi:DNA recombination protein RmuC